MKKLILPLSLIFSLSASAQLVIDNATFFIDDGAVVTVQGDVTSNVNIQVNGTGKIRMAGTSLQNISLGGKDIPNLQIDNSSAAVVMTTPMRVTKLLEFTNGKLQLGANDLTLATTAAVTGAATAKFAETNGAGFVKKEVTAAGNYVLPVGINANYSPLEYQLTAGSYSTATVSAQAVAGAHPQKHPRSSDYLTNYWKLASAGITGGTKVAVGTYADAAITGTEADIRSLYWNGTTWVIGTTQDVATNKVTAPVVGATNEVYGMNKFILVSPKVFLQGAFNISTGLMNDNLRTGANAIPMSDPYRTLPYSSSFGHVANNDYPESVTSAAVFNDLPNPENQIVDWVFVELREKNTDIQAPVVQTRSVLVQRDGDLVDIDGVSPVYFKNVDPKSIYVVSIRHRNHLGISSNPVSPLSLGLSTSVFDFSNTAATASIFGTAGVNYLQSGNVLKNVMWSGNARNNAFSNWSGLNNDKDYLYVNVLGSNSAATAGPYSAGDFNMDKSAKWSGLNNDKDFLYQRVLGSNSASSKPQALPQ